MYLVKVMILGVVLFFGQVASSGNGEPVQVPAEAMKSMARHKVPPIYPYEAKQRHIQGSVVMHVVINELGDVVSVDVVSGPEELRAAATESVHQWVYEPYRVEGKVVSVETTVTLNFALRG